MYKTIIASTLGLMTSACATLTTGTTQPVNVETTPHAGAECTLRDSAGGKWLILDTPGVVNVTKGDGPMRVKCRREQDGKTFVGSRTMNEKLQVATAGNLLVGGFIGLGVDMVSGAAQKYDTYVEVYLREIEAE